ncbi:MAG: glycoside hydrolase family 127 protein, partial [Lentisphaeria bacterium]|nr:glycoside hydrolase family 127 protein [Lentisphaeria bacterium]
RDHELYCAGHLIEAAVAHFEATGKRKFLDAMCRCADLIAATFGRGAGQMRGYPGHEEIELALVKLYRATKEKRYLDLARYFIDERGAEPNYFTTVEGMSPTKLPNLQADKPVREQTAATGHAVRALYLYSAIADVATESGDAELLTLAQRLFDNIAERRMYITGGVGSSQRGEAFTCDFALPNDTAYSESCAAMALVLFAKRLLDHTGDRKYAEVMEKALYNNVASGISLDGRRFFYANPLEVNATTLELMNTGRVRQEWFSCSCCPTSYCRFLPQLGRFCAAATPERLRIDIPAAMRIDTPGYAAELTGGYPYSGDPALTIRRGGDFELAIRIPAWCRDYAVKLNGADATELVRDGYWRSRREWKPGDRVELALRIVAGLRFADPRVPADSGRAAIQRGPLVYCVESADNPGVRLHSLRLPAAPEFRESAAEGLPAGTVALHFPVRHEVTPEGELFSETVPAYALAEATAIPYALWQNRGAGAMQVFLLRDC